MNCENYLCIYQKDGNCKAEEPSINTLGMCEDCIIVSIPEKELKKYKVNDLKKFNDYWKDEEKVTR